MCRATPQKEPMASVNKVVLLGNVGKDPEMRYMASGQPVASVSIATTSKRKDRNTGETVEDTQWHRVVFYERLAEIVQQYVKKGHPIYIEGRLKYGKYTDQSGVERYTTDIIATELQLLGGRDNNAPQGHSSPPPPRQSAPTRSAAPQQQRAAQPPANAGFNDMEDDIPFISCEFGHDLLTSKARKLARYDF